MSTGHRLLFIFLDGVGLGADDPAVNPFVAAATPNLDRLLGGRPLEPLASRDAAGLVVRQLYASLGLPGLPQSATGQTSLLTGLNAAEAMGGHYGPWPGPTLRRLLDRGNLFAWAAARGLSSTVANAYPPGYFRALEEGRSRTNAPVHAALGAGVELRGLAEFSVGEAVSADLTGGFLNRDDKARRVIGPEQSGEDLRRLALGHDFTFFDFWLSDHVGHRGSFDEAAQLVTRLDSFLGTALPDRGDGLTVILTSDHGNLEDKTVRTHTHARVPLVATGPQAGRFAGCADLRDVAVAARAVLGI